MYFREKFGINLKDIFVKAFWIMLKALQEINNILKLENMQCSDFGLPEPDKDSYINLENEKVMISHQNISEKFISQLNVDQKIIFD